MPAFRLRLAILGVVSGWFGFAPAQADEYQWVVVSMRQYLVEGSSRIHLYLYSFDGTFKKALTDDPGFNDRSPIFSSDGKTIRFTREATDEAHAAKAGDYLLDLESGALRAYHEKTQEFDGGSARSMNSIRRLNLIQEAGLTGTPISTRPLMDDSA